MSHEPSSDYRSKPIPHLDELAKAKPQRFKYFGDRGPSWLTAPAPQAKEKKS